MLARTYAYRVHALNESNLDTIIEESRQHLIDKYGQRDMRLKKVISLIRNLTKPWKSFGYSCLTRQNFGDNIC